MATGCVNSICDIWHANLEGAGEHGILETEYPLNIKMEDIVK